VICAYLRQKWIKIISYNYLLNTHEAAVKLVKQIRNTHKYKIQNKISQHTAQM